MSILSIGSLNQLPINDIDPASDLILIDDGQGSSFQTNASTLISRESVSRYDFYRCETVHINSDPRKTKSNIFKHIHLDDMLAESSAFDCSIECIVELNSKQLAFDDEYILKDKKRILPPLNMIKPNDSNTIYMCNYNQIYTYNRSGSQRIDISKVKINKQDYALSCLFSSDDGFIKFDNISYRSGKIFDTTININIHARI